MPSPKKKTTPRKRDVQAKPRKLPSRDVVAQLEAELSDFGTPKSRSAATPKRGSVEASKRRGAAASKHEDPSAEVLRGRLLADGTRVGAGKVIVPTNVRLEVSVKRQLERYCIDTRESLSDVVTRGLAALGIGG